MTARGDRGNILVEKDGRTLRLHSSRPEAEAEKLAASISPGADALFLGGVGLGWLLEEALRLPRLRHVFAIEPSPEIAALAQEMRPDLARLKQNPRVLWIESPEGLSLRLRDVLFSELAVLVPRVYGELFGRDLALYQKIFAEVLSRKEVSKNTLSRFGKTWIKNFFRNLPRYLACVKAQAFAGCGKGSAALVIGAGPSLDEALPRLREVQGKAFLIAADTALPMLEAAGIEPDFTLSVDPQEINAFYLRYPKGRSHYLVADPGLHDSAFEGYPAEKIALCDAAFPFYESFRPLWGTCGSLASGGSVSTSAFDFARALGCDPIILVGQDLSFTARKSHGAGNVLWELGRAKYTRLNPYHNTQARSMYPFHTLALKGRRGEAVAADSRFAAFAGWFSEEIPKTKAAVCTAGLDGAYLEGARHLDMAEAFSLIRGKSRKDFHPPVGHAEKAPIALHLGALQKDALLIRDAAEKACACSLRGDREGLFRESGSLQRMLTARPDCARIVEVGIQGSVWKALETGSGASENERFHTASVLVSDIRESLGFFLRILRKASILLEKA